MVGEIVYFFSKSSLLQFTVVRRERVFSWFLVGSLSSQADVYFIDREKLLKSEFDREGKNQLHRKARLNKPTIRQFWYCHKKGEHDD